MTTSQLTEAQRRAKWARVRGGWRLDADAPSAHRSSSRLEVEVLGGGLTTASSRRAGELRVRRLRATMSGDSTNLSPESVLRGYFHAKDENRPHMLEHVFSVDAELIVVNQTNTISFPAHTVGREAIADVLVRDFAVKYENVYSFYLSRPHAAAEVFSCGWLVTMSEKQSKSARVGCGRYDWSFEKAAPHLATHLTITIQAMQSLPPSEVATVLAWVQNLSYPWCTAKEVARAAPKSDFLAPVLQHLTTYE